MFLNFYSPYKLLNFFQLQDFALYITALETILNANQVTLCLVFSAVWKSKRTNAL